MNDKGYWVVIEWDGLKPNNAFYHRLKLLSSGVQKGTAGSAPPIARRSTRNKNAIIVQESAIYCADEQLARAIALLAQKYGAKDVLMSQVVETKPVEADEQDLYALSRIEQIAGARGRRSSSTYSEDRSWTVLCYNEMTMHQAPPGRKPINCPECGSFMCEVYSSSAAPLKSVQWNPSGTIFQSWLNLRFRRGRFYPTQNITHTMAKKDSDGRETPFEYDHHFKRISRSEAIQVIQIGTGHHIIPSMDGRNSKSAEALLKMATSDLFFLDAFRADIPTAIKLLDGMWVSQVYIRPERRQQERIAAIVRVLSDHRDVTISQLAERDDELDIFDAAAHVDHTTLSNAFTDINAYYEDSHTAPSFYKKDAFAF